MNIIEKIQGCTNKGCSEEVALIKSEICEIRCSNCEQFQNLTLFKFPPHPALLRRGLKFFYGCWDWRCVTSEHYAFTPSEKMKLLNFSKNPSHEDVKVFRNFSNMLYGETDISFGDVWLHAMHQQGRRREKSNDEICPICLDTINPSSARSFPCSHMTCSDCSRRSDVKKMKECPICRLPIKFDGDYDNILRTV